MFEFRKCFLIISLVWFQLGAQKIAEEINENSATSTKVENAELLFAHILYRHGDRNPINSFPTDPWKNESFWPRGYGSLTNVSFILMNCIKSQHNVWHYTVIYFYFPDRHATAFRIGQIFTPKISIASQRWKIFKRYCVC